MNADLTSRTIPLSILRLIYLWDSSKSSNITMNSFNFSIVTVIHTNYSIITSCLPFLKPILDVLAVGVITNDVRIPLDNQTLTSNKAVNAFALLSGKGRQNLSGWTKASHSAAISGGQQKSAELGQFREGFGSQDRMVINETRTTEVVSSAASATPSQ